MSVLRALRASTNCSTAADRLSISDAVKSPSTTKPTVESIDPARGTTNYT